MLKNLADAALFAALIQWLHGSTDTGTRPRNRTGVRMSRVHRGRWMGSLKVGRLRDLNK